MLWDDTNNTMCTSYVLLIILAY